MKWNDSDSLEVSLSTWGMCEISAAFLWMMFNKTPSQCCRAALWDGEEKCDSGSHFIYLQLLYEFMLSRIKVDQNATSFLCLESSWRHHFVNNNWESHNPQHPYIVHIVSLSMFYPCYCHFRSTQKNSITIITQKFHKKLQRTYPSNEDLTWIRLDLTWKYLTWQGETN